jgi:hypothetical protein
VLRTRKARNEREYPARRYPERCPWLGHAIGEFIEKTSATARVLSAVHPLVQRSFGASAPPQASATRRSSLSRLCRTSARTARAAHHTGRPVPVDQAGRARHRRTLQRRVPYRSPRPARSDLPRHRRRANQPPTAPRRSRTDQPLGRSADGGSATRRAPEPDMDQPRPRQTRSTCTLSDRTPERHRRRAHQQLRQPKLLPPLPRPIQTLTTTLVLDGTLRESRQDSPLQAASPARRRLTSGRNPMDPASERPPLRRGSSSLTQNPRERDRRGRAARVTSC